MVIVAPTEGVAIPSGVGLQAHLQAVNVSAWFGSKKVLDRVNLAMPHATVTALIGPSGCGKSTFIRILNRMHETISSAKMAGEVRLNGEDIYAHGTKVTETRRRIGMVFQRPTPFPTMSIADNVAAGLRASSRNRLERKKEESIVEESLKQAGLWDEVKDRLRDSATALSGGQQQRLCIARALATRPSVILLDEPTASLDPLSTQKVEELVHKLRGTVTIIIVTHNMQQAARVSDRTAFMLLGELVETAPTSQIFTTPSDPRTEAYITGRFG